MTVASIPSRALLGIDAVEVMVEAHLSAGLPGFTLVGLPETAVKESRERVRNAIINSALAFPDQRVTVNLAPADLPKAGGTTSRLLSRHSLHRSKSKDSQKPFAVSRCLVSSRSMAACVRFPEWCRRFSLHAKSVARLSCPQPIARRSKL